MMKKWKEKAASKAGFTLVELIVVIAVLAILAAVAVPTYSGYIKKANEAADYTQLDAIKTAATFAYIDANHDGTVSKITVKDGKVYVNTDTTNAIDISAYYTGTGTNGAIAFKSDNDTAVWENGAWTLSKSTT